MQTLQWQKRAKRAATLSAVFGLGLLTACGLLRGNVGAQSTRPPVQPSAQVIELQNSFEKVADHLRPSVVFIESRKSTRSTISMEDDSGFPFGFQFPGAPRGFRMVPPRSARATGSGVIVRGDGYILTNDHVVQGADKVTVRMQDGREFVGQVRRDFKSDLALIKVEATGLPYAEFADSDKVKIGQWAIAFGSPFGLKDTMTVGIVSSLHRNTAIGRGAEGRYYPSLIQTDASINPGNSGGPLVDIYGRIIGINVAIESPTGANAGVGFAIPANTARYVMEELIQKGSVTRGFLGVALETLDYEQRKQYNVKQGVMITSLTDKTPAAEAGLQVEDIILRYNGKEVANEADLRDMISRTAPGTSVAITVLREGRERTVNAKLGTAPEPKAPERRAAPARNTQGKLGVRVTDTDDTEITGQLQLSNLPKEGALIVEVVPGSPASEAGLQPGDTITRINGKRIANAEALTAAVREIKQGTVSLVLRRGENTILARVELE